MAGIAQEGCIDPTLGDELTDYCFGELPELRREVIERHLLDCEICRDEFVRLERSVRILRSIPEVHPSLPRTAIASQLGLSARLAEPFGGYRAYALAVSVLFGLEWMVGVWSELGYSYDRFGSTAWMLSAPVTVSVTMCLLAALWLDARGIRSGSRHPALAAGTLLALGLTAITVAIVMVLPTVKTILASFETRTAAGGYFKDILLIFLPLLLFVLPTFHAVLVLQRELKAGRHQAVLKLLTGAADALPPRGVWCPSPRTLGALLAILGIMKVLGTNNMLDALAPGPYAGLFTYAAYISTAIWFAIGAGSLVWYWRMLQELKREAVAGHDS